MKSLALSLLVAVGLSLGASTAFAEITRVPTQSSLLSAAAASMQQAKIHADRAQQYRAAARVATEKARLAFQVADNDLKQGFTYEAGVEREKGLKLQREAQMDLTLAAREDALAAHYRAQAQKEMALFQQTLGTLSPSRR